MRKIVVCLYLSKWYKMKNVINGEDPNLSPYLLIFHFVCLSLNLILFYFSLSLDIVFKI